MENVVIFHDHLEYFTAIWYNLWPFGQFVVLWYIFALGMFGPGKIWQPWIQRQRCKILQRTKYVALCVSISKMKNTLANVAVVNSAFVGLAPEAGSLKNCKAPPKLAHLRKM
jgi:hypothetical protein